MGLLFVVVVCVCDERAKSHTSITQTQPEDLGVNSRVSCTQTQPEDLGVNSRVSCVCVCMCVFVVEENIQKVHANNTTHTYTKHTHTLSFSDFVRRGADDT